MRTFISLLALPYCVTQAQQMDDNFGVSLEAGISLLQLRAQSRSNVSHLVRRPSPAARERAQCPHEIEVEEVKQGNKRFGCSGLNQADEVVSCSFWGEPHITSLFPGRPRGIDVLYKVGHFRLAAAKDGSWEIQVFNCGLYASAVAARFGKSLVEVFADSDSKIHYFLNGQEVDLPADGPHGVRLWPTHRSIMSERMDAAGRIPAHYPGTCADDPGGQVSIDIAQDIGSSALGDVRGNINVKIDAARSAVTTDDEDHLSLCNEVAQWPWRMAGWDNPMVEHDQSIFTIGDRMCEACNGKIGWGVDGEPLGNDEHGKHHCATAVTKTPSEVSIQGICAMHDIAVADAAEVCKVLRETPQFFEDCQIDYCASGGDRNTVAEAIGEEAMENPQPQCIKGDDCDPASKCCNALRDQATLTLDNVMESSLCSGGVLRYGSALTQNGQIMDLVVTAVGDFECKGKMDDSKFGSKNAEIGILGVLAGTQQTFDFKFVQHGTHTPATPSNLMMSFLDLDQGKSGKQREFVEVCGSGAAITTDDTELEMHINGDCVKMQSTTAGTGKDNPDTVESMSQSQRARAVAFEVTGSSFTATLGVSRKGRNPRKFNFAGHPSVACVLK